jgi:hypothetical protein
MTDFHYSAEALQATVNDKVRAAAVLVDKLYDEHPAGGYLHIVTDDLNIQQYWIDWCFGPECAESMRRPMTDIERQCGTALRALTVKQRASAIAIYEGWLPA